MEESKPPNFRGVRTAIVIEVCEGNGTEESPKRAVMYVYNGNTQLGKIDPHRSKEPAAEIAAGGGVQQ